MSLSINTTDIKLGYERIPSRLSIETNSAKLELHQKHAKVNIETELPRILIDQYECFASAGLKNNYDFISEISQIARQDVLEFIGKTAEDGKLLAAIEKGSNPIAYIAKRDASPEKVFILGFIPKASPRFDVTGGSIKIDPERNSEGANNGVEGNYIPGDISIKFSPAKININVLQYPSVSINYIGNDLDKSI
ncbi:MAG: hypothetical protein FIA99_00100 [Ruminiclostridium sp.]|nr:hypothetical protein [Ruminiclostridium sp.]